LVLCQSGKEGLILQAVQDDLAIRYHLEGPCASDAIAFTALALASFEGRRDELVELEQVSFGKGQARWRDSSGQQVLELETVTPESVPQFPPLPKQFTPMPAGFLQALDESARTTPKEYPRFALTRMRLRGKTGEIVATDGRQLLIQKGFPFPWSDAVLVPRVSAFGYRELLGEEPVTIGRTKSHVAIQVGCWTFLLRIDTAGRFPDVDAVIPKASSVSSRLHLDTTDAECLMAALPNLPGHDQEHSPITLDLGTPITVRARREGQEQPTEIVLARSRASGPPLRFACDRTLLLRALKLGFTEIEVVKTEQPVVCRNERGLYVWMPLEPKYTIPATTEYSSPTPSERSNPPMPQSTSDNGNGHLNGSTEPERWGIAEVIAETETLRTQLQDAAARTARLLAALKHQRRRSRAVQQAMQSLKQLQLDR
jgi:hypothetical protein